MPGVRIVTDSACDLGLEDAEQHHIIIVPLTIRFDDEEFLDRRELSPTEFWRRCKEASALPQTAAPSPGSFQEAFAQAADEGAEGVVCLTLSSGVSATYASARTAAESFERIPVEVVDTRSLTMGQGLMAIAAAEDAAAGASLADIAAATTDRATRTHVYGVLGGLDHLQRGGRIGSARAMMGSLLSIKPVLQVKDGEVAEESKQRTRSHAIEYLVTKVAADQPIERLAACNGACDDFDNIVNRLRVVESTYPLVSVDLGPVVGTHAGPSTMGVCYIEAAK